MKKVTLPLIMALGMFLASCTATQKHMTSEHHKKHWSYDGETAPAFWATFETESECGSHQQSPINIITKETKETDSNQLKFHYTPSTLINNVVNNGHSIQFNFDDGNTITFGGKEYALKQLHFHESSEHTINGIRYPIEIHLVHVSSDNKIAVVGILGYEGDASQQFSYLTHFLPLKPKETQFVHHKFNLSDILPKQKDYYTYSGSLTTPPCSEHVNWIVFQHPISLSLEQVEKIHKNMPDHNYRPTQPLNGRTVHLSKE